jgi:transcriptional regulator with XRE-family HTH domain
MLHPDCPAPPPLTTGPDVRARREQLGLTIDGLALRLETEPRVSARQRAAYIEAMEAGVMEISAESAQALANALSVDLRVFDPAGQSHAA